MLLAGIVVIALIIVANAYFVAQEFAFMSVDRTQLRTAAARGDKTAQRALHITERTSFMLSGAQLGITISGLLIGYVAEPLVGEALGGLLGGVGVRGCGGLIERGTGDHQLHHVCPMYLNAVAFLLRSRFWDEDFSSNAHRTASISYALRMVSGRSCHDAETALLRRKV